MDREDRTSTASEGQKKKANMPLPLLPYARRGQRMLGPSIDHRQNPQSRPQHPRTNIATRIILVSSTRLASSQHSSPSNTISYLLQLYKPRPTHPYRRAFRPASGSNPATNPPGERCQWTVQFWLLAVRAKFGARKASTSIAILIGPSRTHRIFQKVGCLSSPPSPPPGINPGNITRDNHAATPASYYLNKRICATS